jgi:hypothetical protein
LNIKKFVFWNFDDGASDENQKIIGIFERELTGLTRVNSQRPWLNHLGPPGDFLASARPAL